TVTADYIEVPEDNAQVSLQIQIEGKALSYREENGRHRFEAEIVTMIFNSDGKRVDLKSEVVNGNLTPARLVVAKQNGFQYNRRVQLKPGLYQVRVGVREPSTGLPGERKAERMGTAAAWIETPDLSKKNRLALSSLLLSDAVMAQLTPPASKDGNDNSLTPSTVVLGVRYYRANQPVIYFFRLYNAANDKGETDAMMQIDIFKDEKP